jgi:WD40 repeat protein
MHFR